MKRSRLRKTAKKDTLGYWKNKFWGVFSKYIRERDEYICFTCGKEGKGKGMHAGHFIPRRSGGLSLFFHEENVWSQCFHCNINLGGNGAEFYRRLVERIGADRVEELFRLRDQGFRQYTIQEYKDLIEEYNAKIEALQD